MITLITISLQIIEMNMYVNTQNYIDVYVCMNLCHHYYPSIYMLLYTIISRYHQYMKISQFKNDFIQRDKNKLMYSTYTEDMYAHKLICLQQIDNYLTDTEYMINVL